MAFGAGMMKGSVKLVPPFRFSIVCCSAFATPSDEVNLTLGTLEEAGPSGDAAEGTAVEGQEVKKRVCLTSKAVGDRCEQEVLYRGAFPSLLNYLFLKTLGLSTIVSIVKGGRKEITADLLEFCRKEKVDLVVVDLSNDTIPKLESVSKVLSLLSTRKRLPAFVHCRDGGESTGIFIMCLRMLQGWPFESACNEYARYVKGGCSTEARSFVSSFLTEKCELPEVDERPSWL